MDAKFFAGFTKGRDFLRLLHKYGDLFQRLMAFSVALTNRSQALMNENPKWLKEPHQAIIVAFKRMGGRGNISDVRFAAKVHAGDPFVRKLIANGLMRQRGHDFYELTPDGFALANRLISDGM
jgi:hypothetical protein